MNMQERYDNIPVRVAIILTADGALAGKIAWLRVKTGGVYCWAWNWAPETPEKRRLFQNHATGSGYNMRMAALDGYEFAGTIFREGDDPERFFKDQGYRYVQVL